jgi:hypothetical protein
MGRGSRRALLAGVGVLVVACGSAPPATFHPGGANPAGAGDVAGPSSSRLAQTASQRVTWPPFGSNVHVIMPAWLPAARSEVPAVITAKNFLLAFLYAEYKGSRDHRWAIYVTGQVSGALAADLSQPGVTTESFTGTIRFSQMRAFPDPSMAGAVDVSECFSNARSANVGLHTGHVIPDTTPPDQRHYRNTDVLTADRAGHWHIVSVYPVIYYPQAKECTA